MHPPPGGCIFFALVSSWQFNREKGISVSLTEDFISLLFDRDLISDVTLKAEGGARLYPHYQRSSKMWALVDEPGQVHILKVTESQVVDFTTTISKALEYVEQWSLNADSGQALVRTTAEAERAARDLINRLPLPDGLDSSALDLEKLTAYVTYPRVGNHSVLGLLVKLPESRAQLISLLEECRND